VAQLYSWALGFLFVASYDTQGSGGGIRTRLHTGRWEVLNRGPVLPKRRSHGGNPLEINDTRNREYIRSATLLCERRTI
jgi:hypothetical protein